MASSAVVASSECLGNLQYHIRSISLPARLQNPNAIRVESQLNKLRSFEESKKTSPLTLDAIQSALIALSELYIRSQELMASPTIQAAALIHCQRGNVVVLEEALERSVEVLDSCTAIRDMFSMIKEHVLVLQSALRRKNGDPSIECDIKGYICLRKKVGKEAAKRLRILKKMESMFTCLPDLDMDPQLNLMFGVLNDVAVVTVGILRSLLVFLADSKVVKLGAWSLIAKLMIKNSTASSEKGKFLSNVEGVDSALDVILENLRSPADDSKNYVQIARKRLDIFTSNIEGLENGLECLFRKLISNRVTLLNILNH